MYRLLTLFLIILGLTTASMAGVGELGVYPDPAGTECTLTDAGGSLLTYVIHTFSAGDEAIAVGFKMQPPAGATWTEVAWSSLFLISGTPTTTLTIGYGGCQTTAQLVATVEWNSINSSPPCGKLELLPPTGEATVIATDCAFLNVAIPTTSLPVNCDCPLPVETSTWGSVKALYR